MQRILVINFFPAFVPPSSGGELRYFHLYSRLSQHFDVTLLSPTFADHPREVVTHSPTFREHRIPKDPSQDQLHMSIENEKLTDEFSALVCALAARHPNQYHQAYCELQATADVIIHESPYMLDYDVLAGVDRRPRIYNSYNVESDLVTQLWKGPSAAKYLDLINKLERRLCNQSDACFAVSKTEAQRFVDKYSLSSKLFTIIENGIVAEEFGSRKLGDGNSLVALFFGSLHPPNIEAAEYIIRELAPVFPTVAFVIAGNCLPASSADLPPNVKALGRVDNEQRLSLFATADIALNPMCSGSGTNLKALEYLAASLPMVSTPLGARGLELVDNRHALIADTSQFANALQDLVSDPELRTRLAVSGRKHVVDRFSWDAIAQRAASAIHGVLKTHAVSGRRHILLLNDFSVAQPLGGGEVRINKIYSALGQHYDITLLCFGHGTLVTRTEIAPGFLELQVPKTDKHRAVENSQTWHISAADIINYQEAPKNALLVSMAVAIAKHADIAVLSHPYMAGLIKYLNGIPVIYESHNIETDLKRALLVGHPAYAQMTSTADECERLAITWSSEVISVAAADFEGLTAIGGKRDKMHLVPNGVDVPPAPPNRSTLASIRAVLKGRPLMIFIGSAHPPNIDAANYIIRQLASQLGEFIFGIIGSVCNATGTASAPNVICFGILDDETKNVVLELADVALNPMLSGSGSNLKLADYFARSLPTVTTPFGARGYRITSGVEAIICPLDQFPNQLRNLVAKPLLCESMGETAYRFARTHLDWKFQAEKYRRVLERRMFANHKKKMLVVTYRFTNPPLGGAETYLLDLLREVDRRGDFVIDLVTTDISTIENNLQFSCSYERSMEQPSFPELVNLEVFRFGVDELEPAARLRNATRLWAAWIEESIGLSLAQREKLPDAILLGGWYYPERGPNGASVWSALKALIRVKGASSLTLRGSSNHKTLLTIFGDGVQLSENMINGNIEVRQLLNNVEVIELRIATPFISPDDPRELGLRIREILLENVAGTTKSLPLELSYSDILKRVVPREYIRSLIDVARERPAELDVLFQETRGPSSIGMEEWLRKNATNYDIILGHSMPFRTTEMAANAARSAGVPLVQLPHTHIDDVFYHWESYFQALRSAAVCITHPRAASSLFFDRIGASSWYCPHGVENKGRPSPEDERAFKNLYRSDLPYVLVLGRKDRSKNYQGVIDAVSQLNRSRKQCNVVMIGRDEDGEPLDSNLVMYFGGQLDGVVRAALGGSLCLVTMSDSESFGIVILEAWSQRRPAIVSENCLASTELVVDQVCGLVANMENLPEKILSLLNDREWASEMGARGFERVQAEFSWDVIGARLNDMLLKLSNAPSEESIQTSLVMQ